MKRKFAALFIVLSTVIGPVAMITTASASQPPGLLGYEGQPGNQGGGNHHP